MTRGIADPVRIALALGLCVGLAACGPDAVEPPPRPVMVAQPEPAAPVAVAFAATVVAREQPELAFRVGGRIIARKVDAGARVRAGQVLAELDPDDLSLQVEAARAQVAAAESERRLAETERDRYRALLERQLISPSDFDARQARLEAAAARLREAEAQLAVARNQAGYARLEAPVDGVIVERRADVGQVVAAGQAVFVLAVDGPREVAFSVPERDIGGFALGQAVTVETWAQPGRRIRGRVRELSPEADALGRTYAARVALEAADFDPELGQSARVFVAGNDHGALMLPLPAAARFGEESFVWVLAEDGSTLQRRMVTISRYLEDRVVIEDGITADDWVVVAGTSLLEDGQRVRAVDRDNRPVPSAVATANITDVP